MTKPKETTEWEDIMVAKGIWAAREDQGPTPEDVFQHTQGIMEAYDPLKGKTEKQLDDMVDDDLDFEDDDFMK